MVLRLQREKGFTLIELIFVIGMLSLLSCIALPKLDISTYALLNTSKALRDDIRYVRYMKMTEGENQRLLFERNRYRILEGTKVVKQVWLPEKFSLYQNFTASQLYFSYNGAPSTGGNTLTLVNDKSKKYCQVTVVPATGRILLKNKVFSGYK